MKVDFLLATEDDIYQIVDLCNEVFAEKTLYEDALKIFKQTQNDNNQIYLIGKYDGEIVAHTKIAIIPTIFADMNTFAILNHVCVKEKYRKHHIATQMLEKVKEICRENGCTTMKLWSKNFRLPAHSCYKNFGFKIEDAAFFSINV